MITHTTYAQKKSPSLFMFVASAAVSFGIVTGLFVLNTFVVYAQEVTTGNTVTTQKLNTENTNIQVSTIEIIKKGNDSETRTVQADKEKGYVLYKDKYMGFSPIQNILGYYTRTTIIQFSGKSEPNAVITLLLDNTKPMTMIVSADDTGEWTLDLHVDDLQPGDYNATMKTTVDNAVSDTIVVGKFSVGTVQLMSNTTWMALVITGTGAILFLLVLNIIVMMRHRAERKAYKK